MKTSGESGLNLKEILVPVDFSTSSLHALSYATRLAREFGAKCTLLYVVEPAVPTDDGAVGFIRLQEDTEKAARRRLESLARELSCRAMVRIGAPAREITSYAGEMNADLIVIGTHGRSRLSRALLGSVAEQVIRHAGCPVFVIREKKTAAAPPAKVETSKLLEVV